MSLCCLDALSYFLQETKSSLVCFICFILVLAADSSNDETALIPAFVTSSDGKTSWLFYQTWFVPVLFKRQQFTFCQTQKSQKWVGLGAELTWSCVCDWLGGIKDCNIKLWWKRTGDCFSIILLSTPFFSYRTTRSRSVHLDQYVFFSNYHPALLDSIPPLPPTGSARATQHILELPEELRSSPDVSLALSINRAFMERNPVRLLRLAKGLTFLETCALHRHLVACRRDLLLIYSHGFSIRNCRFPLDRLAQLLDLDSSLTEQICQAHGQEVDKDNHVVFSKAAFSESEQDKLHCKLYHIAEAKKNQDVSIRNIIHGCV